MFQGILEPFLNIPSIMEYCKKRGKLFWNIPYFQRIKTKSLISLEKKEMFLQRDEILLVVEKPKTCLPWSKLVLII